MRRISLVAIDLDGTLLTSEKLVAPEGARLIKLAVQSGIHVVLATTRNPHTVQSFCRLLEISTPMICTNGAQVWGSPAGPVWAHHFLPPEIALAIGQLADRHDWELSITVGSMTYWRQRPGQALGPIGPNRLVVAKNADAVAGDVVRILAHQPEAIDSIRSLCQSRFPGQCFTETFCRPDSSVNSLGVFAPQANKGTALALVLDRLCIAPQQVIAIGDNINDLAMFAHARVCVAMGNAPDKVKQRATAVATANDEEGVAWALQRFVLGQS